MVGYSIINGEIVRADGAHVPRDPANADYQDFLHQHGPTGAPMADQTSAAPTPSAIDAAQSAINIASGTVIHPGTSPMTAAMSLTPTKSTAATTLSMVQALKDVIADMNAANANTTAVIAKLRAKVSNQQAMNSALDDLANKMDV